MGKEQWGKALISFPRSGSIGPWCPWVNIPKPRFQPCKLPIATHVAHLAVPGLRKRWGATAGCSRSISDQSMWRLEQQEKTPRRGSSWSGEMQGTLFHCSTPLLDQKGSLWYIDPFKRLSLPHWHIEALSSEGRNWMNACILIVSIRRMVILLIETSCLYIATT